MFMQIKSTRKYNLGKTEPSCSTQTIKTMWRMVLKIVKKERVASILFNQLFSRASFMISNFAAEEFSEDDNVSNVEVA